MEFCRLRYTFLDFGYRKFFKPALFLIDPEKVHEVAVRLGGFLGNYSLSRSLLKSVFSFESLTLSQDILGISFPNPVGLAAGYDYDGYSAHVMRSVGFGFNTVGTVTAKPYGGNKRPMLYRLPKSEALLINKGFKSEGSDKVAWRLDRPNLEESVLGVSIGSSNIPEVDTVEKSINDILYSFKKFSSLRNIKYFELNISCPNTAVPSFFIIKENFEVLVEAVSKLHINVPVFIKMPSEIEKVLAFDLVECALKHGINGFIFSNLVKNREKANIDPAEYEEIRHLRGNISGRPTFKYSNFLISAVRERFGEQVVIIGCGGIFSPEDAIAKLSAGADLLQLITGMIYMGPQLIGEINYGIMNYMLENNLKSISDIRKLKKQ